MSREIDRLMSVFSLPESGWSGKLTPTQKNTQNSSGFNRHHIGLFFNDPIEKLRFRFFLSQIENRHKLFSTSASLSIGILRSKRREQKNFGSAVQHAKVVCSFFLSLPSTSSSSSSSAAAAAVIINERTKHDELLVPTTK